MKKLLEQGLYGSLGDKGHRWLRKSKGFTKKLGCDAEQIIGRVSADFAPSPAFRFVIEKHQDLGHILAIKAFIFKALRPTWIGHAIYGLSSTRLVSDILEVGMSGGDPWIGQSEFRDKPTFFSMLPQLSEKEQFRKSRNSEEAIPFDKRQPALVGVLVKHLLEEPRNKVVMLTDQVNKLPGCILHLVHAVEEEGRDGASAVNRLSTFETTLNRTVQLDIAGGPQSLSKSAQQGPHLAILDLDVGTITINGKIVVTLTENTAATNYAGIGGHQNDEGMEAPLKFGAGSLCAQHAGPFRPETNLADQAISSAPNSNNSNEGLDNRAQSEEAAVQIIRQSPLPPRISLSELVDAVQSAIGKPDEPQQINSAIEGYLTGIPKNDINGKLASTLDKMQLDRELGKDAAAARLIGLFMAQYASSTVFNDDSSYFRPILKMFERLDSVDRAIMLRAGLARFTDHPNRRDFSRLACDLAVRFVELVKSQVEQTGDLSTSPLLRGFTIERLGLFTVAQSEIADDELKVQALELHDRFEFLRGKVTFRVLTRTLRRKLSNYRTLDKALFELQETHRIINALDTQRKLEAFMLIACAHFEIDELAVYESLLKLTATDEPIREHYARIALNEPVLNLFGMSTKSTAFTKMTAMFSDKFGAPPTAFARPKEKTEQTSNDAG